MRYKTRTWSESFRAAGRGLYLGWWTGRNMRLHWAAAFAVLTLGAWLPVPAGEYGLLVLTSALVLIAEMVNSALEAAVDLVADDYRPLARQAKDLAAGAVLIAALASLAVALIVFGPYLPHLPGTLAGRWLDDPVGTFAAGTVLVFLIGGAVRARFSQTRD